MESLSYSIYFQIVTKNKEEAVSMQVAINHFRKVENAKDRT